MYTIFNANGKPVKEGFTYMADAQFQLQFMPKGCYVDSIMTYIKETKKYTLSID